MNLHKQQYKLTKLLHLILYNYYFLQHIYINHKNIIMLDTISVEISNTKSWC